MPKKNKLLLIIFFIIIFFWQASHAFASTYYVSSTEGDDTCTGFSQTPYTTGNTACPIKTLTKLNTKIFSPGDNIYFKSNDTFYGSITISQSGTAGNPITFSSYGSGSKPIITGFTNVSSWTNLGNNIWESTDPVSTLSTLNMVTVNDVNTAMGRYPNANATWGGYLKIDSSSSSTSLTNSSLNGTPDWTGAELLIRSGQYRMNRVVVTSQSGSTLNYSPSSGAPTNFGFFIQNDPRTLDQQNEWYYNPTTHKIQMYSVSQPTNVKIASVDKLLTLNASYITIDNISFMGSNTNSIYRYVHNYPLIEYVNIKNSDFLFSGVSSIDIRANNSNIENNKIKDSNSTAINIGYSNYINVRDNLIQNTGVLKGMGSLSGGTNAAIGADVSTNILMEHNSIINTGLNAISFYGNSIIVRNNFIDTFCAILDDGGGIYTYTGTGRAIMNNILIDHNIIINGLGAVDGTYGSFPEIASGIYLDNESANVEVSNNSILSSHEYGIFSNENNSNINIHDNTVYDSSFAQIRINNWADSNGLYAHFSVLNNILMSKSASQFVSYLVTGSSIIPLMGTFNNNYYARPLDSNGNLFWISQPSEYGHPYKTLSEWQIFSSQDANSHTSPVALTNSNDIIFDYNTTSSPITKTLSIPMIDVTGTKYTTSYIIPAYGSIILMPDPNPTPSDTIAPTISTFTIPATSASLSISGITLLATDTVGVTGYLLTGSATAPNPSSGSWSVTAPTTYTFTEAGSKTLYAWAKDLAGNVSTSSSKSIIITLPVVATPPAGTTSGSNLGGGGSSGGGVSSYTLPAPSQTDIQLKAKQKDIKQDGSVNIIDFNIIMTNWNKNYDKSISLSKGDITGDGKIDIFDMNQLMVIWGVKY